MKKQKGTDYSKLLIWSAAMVSIVRYSASFIASDAASIPAWLSDIITFLMGLSGIGMGILGAFGTAYLFDGWRHAMPAAGKSWPFRFKILTGFVFALFITELCILVPFTVSRITDKTMHAALGDYIVWVWGAFVNLAPILLIGGVSVGNQVVAVNQAGNLPENSGERNGKKSENSEDFPVAVPRWNRVEKSEYEWIAQASTGELQSKYGLDERTARNWRKKAQERKAARND